MKSIVLQQARNRLDVCPDENCEALAATIAALHGCAARLSGIAALPDLKRLVRARDAGIEALMRDIRNLPPDRDEAVLMSAVEPSFRARALSYATWEVAANALLATGSAGPEAEWGPRCRPSAPREVARLLAEHTRLRSVWFRNSIRGAEALTVAVYVAQGASLQHAFWVVLGTLSVLRSNALGNDPPGGRRDRRWHRRRRRPGRCHRYHSRIAVGGTPGRGTPRRLRAARDLVRRGAGWLHRRVVHCLQYHPADWMEGRAGTRRGRRNWLRHQPRGRPLALAARRQSRPARQRRRGLHHERQLLRRGGDGVRRQLPEEHSHGGRAPARRRLSAIPRRAWARTPRPGQHRNARDRFDTPAARRALAHDDRQRNGGLGWRRCRRPRSERASRVVSRAR